MWRKKFECAKKKIADVSRTSKEKMSAFTSETRTTLFSLSSSISTNLMYKLCCPVGKRLYWGLCRTESAWPRRITKVRQRYSCAPNTSADTMKWFPLIFAPPLPQYGDFLVRHTYDFSNHFWGIVYSTYIKLINTKYSAEYLFRRYAYLVIWKFPLNYWRWYLYSVQKNI